MIGHKGSLGKFRKTEIISSIFSKHNTMRLEINYKEKTANNTSTWMLNNMLLNNQCITQEIKEEFKKCLERPPLKSLQITNAGEGVEKREPSCTVGENINWCRHYGKQYGVSLKN